MIFILYEEFRWEKNCDLEGLKESDQLAVAQLAPRFVPLVSEASTDGRVAAVAGRLVGVRVVEGLLVVQHLAATGVVAWSHELGQILVLSERYGEFDVVFSCLCVHKCDVREVKVESRQLACCLFAREKHGFAESGVVEGCQSAVDSAIRKPCSVDDSSAHHDHSFKSWDI